VSRGDDIALLADFNDGTAGIPLIVKVQSIVVALVNRFGEARQVNVIIRSGGILDLRRNAGGGKTL